MEVVEIYLKCNLSEDLGQDDDDDVCLYVIKILNKK